MFRKAPCQSSYWNYGRSEGGLATMVAHDGPTTQRRARVAAAPALRWSADNGGATFMEMSDPKRHHYVPVCYLKAWASNGRLLRYHRLASGEIVEDRRGPKSVAFRTHLNTLHGGEYPFVLERYLESIDNAAATVLRSLRTDISPDNLSDGEKRSFAKFVLSLLERHPDRVSEREAAAAQSFEDMMASPKMGPIISSLPSVLLERHANPAHFGRMHLRQLIEDPDWVDRLVRWQWVIGDFKADPPIVSPLVTSDRPVVRLLDEDGNTQVLTLAISPTQIFIVHPHTLELTAEHYVMFLAQYNGRMLTENAPSDIFSSTPLGDGAIQPGGFKLHFRKAMRMYLQDEPRG